MEHCGVKEKEPEEPPPRDSAPKGPSEGTNLQVCSNDREFTGSKGGGGAIFEVLYPSKNFAVVPGPQTGKTSHFFELGQKC